MIAQQLSSIQGCGLGLDVSVLRRSPDIPTSRLGLVSSQEKFSTSRSHLSLGHLRLVPKTYNLTVSLRPCRWRCTQCEKALDIA